MESNTYLKSKKKSSTDFSSTERNEKVNTQKLRNI